MGAWRETYFPGCFCVVWMSDLNCTKNSFRIKLHKHCLWCAHFDGASRRAPAGRVWQGTGWELSAWGGNGGEKVRNGVQSVHSFHNNYYFLILGGPRLFWEFKVKYASEGGGMLCKIFHITCFSPVDVAHLLLRFWVWICFDYVLGTNAIAPTPVSSFFRNE